MEEEGLVIGIPRKGVAVVRMVRSAACRSCCASGLCRSFEGTPDMEIEADDPVGAAEGQKVVLAVPSGAVLKASLLVYILPLVVLLATLAAVQWAAAGIFSAEGAQLAGVLVGFTAMGVTYVILRRVLRVRAERELRPTVISIIG